MKLDLGGIAKGYIVDRLFEWLEDRAEGRGLTVNAGGDLRTTGLGQSFELRIPTSDGDARFALNALDEVGDFLGGLRRLFGQLANLIGDDCEAETITSKLKILLQMSLVLTQGSKKFGSAKRTFTAMRRRPFGSSLRPRQNATQPHSGQKWNSMASPRT